MTTPNDPTGKWMKQSFRDTEDPSNLLIIQKKLLFSVNLYLIQINLSSSLFD